MVRVCGNADLVDHVLDQEKSPAPWRLHTLQLGLQVWLLEERVLVRIIDRGSAPLPSSTKEAPDLETKLESVQTPRGWGLFLIQNMVDEIRVSANPDHHTIELVMHLGGGEDGD